MGYSTTHCYTDHYITWINIVHADVTYTVHFKWNWVFRSDEKEAVEITMSFTFVFSPLIVLQLCNWILFNYEFLGMLNICSSRHFVCVCVYVPMCIYVCMHTVYRNNKYVLWSRFQRMATFPEFSRCRVSRNCSLFPSSRGALRLCRWPKAVQANFSLTRHSGKATLQPQIPNSLNYPANI